MAEESALGKPIGGDLREGKVTLPIILLLQRAGPEVAALDPERHRRRPGHAGDAGGRSRTCCAATARSKRRSSAPSRCATAPSSTCSTRSGPSVERDGLIALADYVVSRDR